MPQIARKTGEPADEEGAEVAGGAPVRRVVAHCDIDAFYASVELRRRPELRGQPIVVAGTGPRSVVTTASYEARRFGIDSAMPAARARALCPQAIFLPPDFTAYRATSKEVWDLVRERVQRVQQVGIDEAYLDVTGVEKPLRVLRALVAEVRERTDMTISVGVGPSRLVAKTVSAAFKPGAFAALSREDACERFAGSPTRILQGVGPKTAERLAAMGIATVGDLQRHDEDALARRWGERMGAALKARSWFFDDSPVKAAGAAKSRSNETTFPQDIAGHDELESVLRRLAEDLCAHLARRGVRGRTIAIKVRLDDWTTVTRARSLPDPTNDPATVVPVVLDLFRAYAPRRPVRLLGVRLASFQEHDARPHDGPGQLVLPL
ncbi:MAG: DNA polymerase IV [Actinomycetota bacterium]|nr:DNA polymerase IV [Actinomycetota bacterium]